jgi:hypothetical protein
MARPLRYEFGLGQVEVSPCMDGEAHPEFPGLANLLACLLHVACSWETPIMGGEPYIGRNSTGQKLPQIEIRVRCSSLEL